MKRHFTRHCVFLALWLGMALSAGATEFASASYRPAFAFSRGTSPGQVLWLTEEGGGILDGPFQGPMAFLTDKNGNHWVGDTLNARVTAFDAQGKVGKAIDLIPAARVAGLVSEPVLLDFVPAGEGRLLVADAGNNAIISLDLRGGKPRAYLPGAMASASWTQINRVHSDKAGRIYIEDVAAMKTVVLNTDGKPFCEPLDGEVGLAVSPDGLLAMVVNDAQAADRRQVVLASAPGEPFVHIAGLKAAEPITWAGIIGFTPSGDIVVVFDTASGRQIVTLGSDGEPRRRVRLPHHDPGYDPSRPEWLGADGSLYTLQAASDSLQILRLE
jgi:sugar lactone lactonase YvrE